ncbi:MAG: LysM peptidoglycan-binding domain-containing protein [Pseudomonadota bacterium]
MVNKQFYLVRHLTGMSAALTLALMTGCASAPEQPQAEPEPTPSTAPTEPAQPESAQPEPAQSEPAREVELKPDYPQSYTVVKGDTLWDISSKFLHDPWMWPQLWQVNPQIENPHLIYPGDVLTLYFIDGKPVLRVERPGAPDAPAETHGKTYPTVKLQPKVRVRSLEDAVPTISLDDIGTFLTRPRVLSEGELEMQPYVVAHTENRLASGAGYNLYARGIKEDEVYPEYVLVRAGDEYVDPDTGEVLGYEAFYLGEARTQVFGDPTKLYVTEANREILRGDRLMPKGDDRLHFSYMPRPPENEVRGKIISVLDGVAQIGQFQVVVLNLGRQEDMAPGHVLSVLQSGTTVSDTIADEEVRLPDEKAGSVMVFRVFERVSYALVMRATKAIHLHDAVVTP